MKKLLLILTFIAFYSNSFSQVTFKPGVRAGINNATISNLDDGSKTGLYIGAFGELRFGGKYALQPEITYSQQGSEHVDLNYLGIRMTNKLYFFNDSTPIFFLISPGIDFNLNGETESYNTDTSAGVNFEADLSFSGGIGYDFPFGLGVEARYKQGIIDVQNDGDLDGRLNSVLQIGALYKFSF